MKFVLNRILSKTQAISIVFLRRERQINTKNKTNKNQILRILIGTLPLIVKFYLLFFKWRLVQLSNNYFHTIWKKCIGLVNSICVKNIIFLIYVISDYKKNFSFRNKWGTTKLSQEVINTRNYKKIFWSNHKKIQLDRPS